MVEERIAGVTTPRADVPTANANDTPPVPELENAMICFAANAVYGRGGQGEFLRQMTYALDRLPRSRVLGRRVQANRSECMDIEFHDWRSACFRGIQRVPVLRRRHDLLTLLNDVNFDTQLPAHVVDVDLFDGVMGQCCKTFEALGKSRTRLALTALNTHIDDLAETLDDEYRRWGERSATFIHPYMRDRVRREIERASRIRVVSEAARRSFVDRGVPQEKLDVVLPGVDLDWFRPVPKTDDVFRVLAVITIDLRKGAYYLLRAFEKAAIPNSELVIIGATGDRCSKKMLDGFIGKMKNIRIQAADVLKEPIDRTYGRASVLVHPAIEDGFALAVAQAMACGKPVITTYQTGASQLIADGRNGYVLQCRDIDGLVDRLRLLAKDEALLNRLSAAAPEAVANLSYDSFAAAVCQFYRRILNN